MHTTITILIIILVVVVIEVLVWLISIYDEIFNNKTHDDK